MSNCFFLVSMERPTELAVIELLSKFLWSNQVSTISKQYALMSLTKLSTRLKHGQKWVEKYDLYFKSLLVPMIFSSEIKDIIETFGSHLHIDLQQRGVEFLQLFGSYNHLRESILERMPAMTVNRMSVANGNIEAETIEMQSSSEKLMNSGPSNPDTLLDLLGSGDDIIMTTPAVNPTATSIATTNLLDLLGDIDLSVPAAPIMISNNNNNIFSSSVTLPILDDNENTKIPDVSIFDINDGNASGNFDLGLEFSPPVSTFGKIVTALDKNDLLVQLAKITQNDCMQIIVTTTNNSMDTFEQYLFQVRLF